MIFNKLYYSDPQRILLEYTIDGGTTWQEASLMPRPLYGNTYTSGNDYGLYVPSVDEKYTAFTAAYMDLISNGSVKFRLPITSTLDVDNIYWKGISGMERYSKDNLSRYWQYSTDGSYHIYTYIRPEEEGSMYIYPQSFNFEFHLI